METPVKRSEYSVAFLEVLADMLNGTNMELDQGIERLHCNPQDYALDDVQCALTPYTQQCQCCSYWVQPDNVLLSKATGEAICIPCTTIDTSLE